MTVLVFMRRITLDGCRLDMEIGGRKKPIRSARFMGITGGSRRG
jgi:hypothetical protein